MDIVEFLKMLKLLIAVMAALKEFAEFLVSLGPIAMDCLNHLWMQWLAALAGWLLTLWIIFWGLHSYLGYSTSLLNRVAYSMFQFLFSVAFWFASLVHILLDYL